VELLPGEDKSVEITVCKDDLRFYHDGDWVLDSSYHIYAGNHSQDKRLSATTVKITN
jgi:hypothetical protein